MDEMRRMHYVVDHYAQLQGLRLVPLGTVVLLHPLVAQLARLLQLRSRYVFVLLAALAVAASFPIRGYYVRRFGEAPTRPARVLPLVAAVVTFAALFALQDLHYVTM